MTHSGCLKIILLLTCSLAFIFEAVAAGRCHMNGQCGKVRTRAGRLPIPCAVDQDPALVNTKELPQETIDEFESLCTAYANLTSGRKLCCDHQQVAGITRYFAKSRQMIGRCPAAIVNFASFFCAMICDPDQSSFLQVTEKNPADNTVNRIRLNVDAKFRDTFYASMTGVLFPITRGQALSWLCHDNSCDPNKLFWYLGQKDTVPFNIDYNFVENGTAPHVVPVTGKQCFEAPSVDEWPENPNPCSCTDCPARCIPAIDFADGSEMNKNLFTYDMVLVVVSVLVSLTAVSTTAYVWYRGKLSGCMTAVAGPFPAASAAQMLPVPNPSPSAIEEGDVRQQSKKKKTNYIVAGIRCWCKYVVFKFPILTILFGIALVVVMSCGLVTLKLESDPVLLWSAPDSRARIEKTFVDQNFGPFFRVNTFIVSISDEDRDAFSFSKRVPNPNDPIFGTTIRFSGIFRKEFMKEILALQSSIHSIPTLKDVCFKPVSEECMVQSPLNFFQSNASRLDITSADETKDYADHLVNCMKNPLLMQDKEFSDPIGCLSKWGGPSSFEVVFGGFSDNVIESEKITFFEKATSFVITILLKNSLNKQENHRAELFEKEFLEKMKSFTNRSVQIRPVLMNNVTKRMPYSISYCSERSVVDEIASKSSPDVTAIALSYLAMFLYIALSLGEITSFVRAKVSLGFAGVVIVLTSVTSSIGFLSFAFGETIVFNLIIIEVVPFLIITVGMNNIFLMVQSIERRNAAAGLRDENVADELAEILSTEAGPSILISSASEAGCFFIGSLASEMPAVSAFATTAGLSLVILIVLQLTVFLSLLFLDAKRERRGKNPDVCLWPFFLLWQRFLCVTQSQDAGIRELDNDEDGGGDGLQRNRNRVEDGEIVRAFASLRESCSLFIFKVIIPQIVMCLPFVVLFVWILSTLFSLHAVPRLSVGLDQEAHLPADSYLRSFFADQKEKMRVGPPLFFVLNTTADSSFDFSAPEYQNLICSLPSCDKDSLSNIVKTNSQDQEMSVHDAPTWFHFMNATGGKKYITGHASSWLDEFLSAWITTTNCCSVKQVAGKTIFCNEKEKSADCSPCVNRDRKLKSPELFWLLLPEFLSASPSVSCPSGGKAAYSFTVNAKNETVKASYFSTFHLPCKNSSDFINSIRSARLVADQIQAKINSGTKSLNMKPQIFPYSSFYVFYEQYLRTWQETAVGLSSSLLTVIVILTASRVLKTWTNHLVFIVTIVSFLLHMMAGMFVMSIELNAVSLVMLMMSVAFSVEFSSHFMIAFAHEAANSSLESDVVSRVLRTTGSSIWSGITLTTLIGIIVLGFAASKIVSHYYFQFYLILVGVGAVHGFIYLPSLCCLIIKRSKCGNRIHNS